MNLTADHQAAQRRLSEVRREQNVLCRTPGFYNALHYGRLKTEEANLEAYIRKLARQANHEHECEGS